jgi:hypothetical protein
MSSDKPDDKAGKGRRELSEQELDVVRKLMGLKEGVAQFDRQVAAAKQQSVYLAIACGAALAILGGMISQAFDRPGVLEALVWPAKWFLAALVLAVIGAIGASGAEDRVADTPKQANDFQKANWFVRALKWTIALHEVALMFFGTWIAALVFVFAIFYTFDALHTLIETAK